MVETSYLLMFVRVYFERTSKEEEMIGSCATWTECRYSDLSWHIKGPQNSIYRLNAEAFYHTKSDLLCLVCRHAVGFLFAPRCIFHYIRIWCVAWKHRGLLDVATVTKGDRSLQRVNCEWTSHSSENNSKNVSIGYLAILSFLSLYLTVMRKS